MPEPPKKPKNGFIRFIQENGDSFSSSKTVGERSVLAASQWKQMSNERKEKYNSAFKKEYVKHISFDNIPFIFHFNENSIDISG